MILWSLVFKAPRSTYFGILCYVSAKFFNILNATKLEKNRVAGVRAERNYSDFDDVKGESAEFEWNIFQGSLRCSSVIKSIILLSSLGQTPELSQEEFYLCLCSTTSSCEGKDNRQQCLRGRRLCENVCKKIWNWSMVFHWTRF